MKFPTLVIIFLAGNFQKSVQNSRISGGDLAKDHQFPWQAGIRYFALNTTYFVAATLIHSEWVLTIAQPFLSHPTSFNVDLGSNEFWGDGDGFVGRSGIDFVIHPNYIEETYENSLGLLRLDSPVEPNDAVQIIPINPNPLESGVLVTVSGFGETETAGGVSDELRYVQLTSISNEDCQKVYEKAVKENMVCAIGNGAEGICAGDFGGPLINEDQELVGIALFISTYGCDAGHPAGFTRIAPYIDWINQILN